MFKVHLLHAQAILQSHSPSQVSLTNQLFHSWGGGLHLQVDLQILPPFMKYAIDNHRSYKLYRKTNKWILMNANVYNGSDTKLRQTRHYGTMYC